MYFIDRNGSTYGPYPLEQLRGYVSAGTILPYDVARDAATGATTTVAALLERANTAAPPPGYAPPSGAYPRPEHDAILPMPPNLHWAILLLITFVCGPFVTGWSIYQMVWVRKLDHSNRSLVYFLAGLGCILAFALIGGGMMAFSVNSHPSDVPFFGFGVLALGMLASTVLQILSIFEVRRSLLAYYNTVEPIGLRLSGVMTFFFHVFYFQHHLSRIATWKHTGYLSPQG